MEGKEYWVDMWTEEQICLALAVSLTLYGRAETHCRAETEGLHYLTGTENLHRHAGSESPGYAGTGKMHLTGTGILHFERAGAERLKCDLASTEGWHSG